jgi:hypothetical protein
MMDSLRRKDTDYRTGLPGYACPLCGRSVFPVSTESSVTFHCKNGHELPLLDLLSAPSPALKEALEQFLAEWRRQHQALTKTMEDARKNGYLKVVEIFQRHAKIMESRIGMVENAFAKSESSSLLLKVPDPLKSR